MTAVRSVVVALLAAGPRPRGRARRAAPQRRARRRHGHRRPAQHPERDDGRGHDRAGRAALAVLLQRGLGLVPLRGGDGRAADPHPHGGRRPGRHARRLPAAALAAHARGLRRDRRQGRGVGVRARARRPGLPRARRPARGLGGRHLQARLRCRRAGGAPAGPTARAPRGVGHARPRAQARRRLLLPDARRHDVPHQLHRPRPARRRRGQPADVPRGAWTSTRPARAISPTIRCAAFDCGSYVALHPGARRERALSAARARRRRSPAGPSASTCRSRRPTPATPRPGCRWPTTSAPAARCEARAWTASTSTASR